MNNIFFETHGFFLIQNYFNFVFSKFRLMDQINSDDDFVDHHFSHDDNDDDIDPLFDHYQDIARSSFDDMVHDQERNELYYQAICRSIEKLRSLDSKKSINVLDIGSGTGLLSMMAVNADADNVIACERFEPMAKCSRKIIDDNSMSSKINVINKCSEQLKLPENFQPNLLVAELLDTELIGEGCLSIYRDIIQRKLVDPDHCLYVPTRARIWIQLVQSDSLFYYHQFRKSYHISDDIEPIQTPLSIRNCFGSHLLHDIQLNRLKPNIDFEILSDPMIIFEFEFNRLTTLKHRDHKRIEIHLKRLFNKPMMIFAWWDIDLDSDGEICLSCGPYWTRGFDNEHKVAWREHWIQTIYYLPAFAFDHERQLNEFNHNQINQNQTLIIDCYHDQVSFWFDLPDQNESIEQSIDNDVIESESWHCTCGLHSHLSRTRLQWINNNHRYQQYWHCLNNKLMSINKNQLINLIYFGDESILPFICSRHPQVEHVWIICNDRNSFRFFQTFRSQNDQKIILCSHKSFRQKPPLTYQESYAIISDLHFRNQSSILSSSIEIFRQLHYQQQFIRNHQIGPEFFFPQRIILRCLIVRFEHLWKCMAPVCFAKINNNQIEYNLFEYDSLIMNARRQVDWQFDCRSLWEYNCWSLVDEAKDILNISMDCSILMDKNKSMNDINSLLTKKIEKIIEFNIQDYSKIDPNTVAIVCWIDQYIDTDTIITGGLEQQQHYNQKLLTGKQIKWIRDQQQLVTFLSSIPNGYQRWNNNDDNQSEMKILKLKFQLQMNQSSIKVDLVI